MKTNVLSKFPGSLMKCAAQGCQALGEMVTTDSYTMAWLGVEGKVGRSKICTDCRDSVQQGKRMVVRRLEVGEPIPRRELMGRTTEISFKPEVLTLEDSEGEDNSDEELIELDGDIDIERLVSVSVRSLRMEDCMEKLGIEMETEVEKAEDDMTSMKVMFQRLEEQMDSIRNELYAEVEERSTLEELPELLIDDRDEQQHVTSDSDTDKHFVVGSWCLTEDHNNVVSPGVVAETPKVINSHRYLIFLESGQATYCEKSVLLPDREGQWRLILPWIKEYVSEYPERVMARLIPNQEVGVEWEGDIMRSWVEKVDCSLVLLRREDGAKEWLYRGDPRLKPLQAKVSTISSGRVGRMQSPPRPVVENNSEMKAEMVESLFDAAPVVPLERKRIMARKSTANKRKFESESQRERLGGEEVKSLQWSPTPRSTFSPHSCCPDCVSLVPYCEDTARNTPLLKVPLLHCGWDRRLAKHSNGGRRRIFYVSPCGRRLRTLKEVHTYLLVTGHQLHMDMFNFDWWLKVLDYFVMDEEPLCAVKDISHNNEVVAVPCINVVDSIFPEFIEYSVVRIPQTGVTITTDLNFLVGCHCVEDCRDQASCGCHKLTIETSRAVGSNVSGYNYRRLEEPIIGGVYECNSRCSCSNTCLNRVAQQPLRSGFQVFKTVSRGWGLRTLVDMPGGAFVCTYVGYLYESEAANMQGKNFGDEYFAELDLMENVERFKDGYESEVEEPEDELNEQSIHCNESEAKVKSPVENDVSLETNKRKSKRLVGATKKKKRKEKVKVSKPRSQRVPTRKLFGPAEEAYIMDAKTKGNLGRYMNHSCRPNVFVQNVFVDTHDLRFPWVAFFTTTYIKAGTELVWDYNYEVGSVPGKRIDCCCGETDCRGRLL